MKARPSHSASLLTGAILATAGRQRPGCQRRRRRWRHVHDDPLGRPGQPRPAVERVQRALPGHASSPMTRCSAWIPRMARIQSGLATDWSVDGTHGAAHPRRGHHLLGRLAADRQRRGRQPRLRRRTLTNQSPFLGTYYPVGATAVADDAARTVTITLAAPAPFVLNGLTDLPIVCAAGMADRASLASATSGTGPYVLSEAAPGDHYTYTIRDGYTWGPDGASTDVEGMPDTVVVRIVENPATAANLLLTGDVNAGHRHRPRRPATRAGGPLLHRDAGAASARCGSTTPRVDRPPTRPCARPSSRPSTSRSCSRCSPPARARRPRPSPTLRPGRLPG